MRDTCTAVFYGKKYEKVWKNRGHIHESVIAQRVQNEICAKDC